MAPECIYLWKVDAPKFLVPKEEISDTVPAVAWWTTSTPHEWLATDRYPCMHPLLQFLCSIFTYCLYSIWILRPQRKSMLCWLSPLILAKLQLQLKQQLYLMQLQLKQQLYLRCKAEEPSVHKPHKSYYFCTLHATWYIMLHAKNIYLHVTTYQVGDPAGETAKGDDDRKTLKRTERPVSEKVSPEKKMPKKVDDDGESNQVEDLIPQTLDFGNDDDFEIPASTGGSADMVVDSQPVVTPSPPPPPPTTPSVDPDMVAALLARITLLESQVKAPPPPPPVSPAAEATPLVTPPPKARALASPPSASTSLGDAAQPEGEDEVEGEAEGDDTGDLLVMPSGKAVTWLRCMGIYKLYWNSQSLYTNWFVLIKFMHTIHGPALISF